MPGTRRHRRRGRSRPDPRARGNGPCASGRGERIAELCTLSAFSVFCALYLGITEDDGYAEQDHRDVARRFGLCDEEFERFLAAHRLREQDVRVSGLDLGAARLDMQVAPEGISRTELARSWYKELLDALPADPAQGDAE